MRFQRREFLQWMAGAGMLGGARLFRPGGAWINSANVGSEPAAKASPQVTFRNVAAEAGIHAIPVCGSSPVKNYILEVYGSGCVWFDYNNDGYVDLYIVNGSTIKNLLDPSSVKHPPRNYLFRNNGDGTFTDVTLRAGVEGLSWGFGAVAADYNNDGYQDLYVYNFGHNILYRNNGNGTFTDVTHEAGVAAPHQIWSAGAAFGDFDNDGHLDLYVAGHIKFDIHHPPQPAQPTCTFRGEVMRVCGPRGLPGAPDVLYHNNGDGTFTDVTEKAGVEDKLLAYGFSVLMEDLDGDGRPDIVVANDSGPNYFYHNNGNGTFTEMGGLVGIAYNGNGDEQANMGIAPGDYDNDGWTDLFTTTFADDNNTLYHNNKGLFVDVSYPSGIGDPSIPLLGMACFWIDYNNDGWKDIFWVNGMLYPEIHRFFKSEHYDQNPQLFENLHNGKFREATRDVGLSAFQLGGRGGAYCDYDNNGALDVAITCIDSNPVLLRNEGGDSAGHWLELRTIGTKSNRDGIGAWVKVVAGNLVQYDRVRAGGNWLSCNDIRLHFGLAEHEAVDLIEIQWPSGHVDRLSHVDANQILVVREGQGKIPSYYKPFKKRA